MGFNNNFNSQGGATVLTDLEVDGTTLVVDETNNRLGIGTAAPGTSLQVEGSAPYITLKNDTSENSDGGCESKIIGEDHANVTLGQIEISHSGSSDDTKGKMILSTHTGSSLTAAVTINEAQKVTAAGDVQVTGDIILDDGGSLKEAGGTAAITFDGSGNVTKIGQDSMSSGDVLTWDGAKFVGEAPTTGDITGVTAGDGLSGGGNTGGVTLAVDLNELSATTVAVANDSIAIIDADDDGSKKESIADLVTAIAGTAASTGLSASSGVLSVSDLHPVGVNGAANQVLTDDGDGTVTSEAGLTFDSGLLTVSGNTDGAHTALVLKNEDDTADSNGSVILRFDLEDTSGTAVDSGSIRVKKLNSFTSTGNTQDAKMDFYVSEDGTITRQGAFVGGSEFSFGNRNSTLNVDASSGTNAAGKSLTIRGGAGTGSGAGGSIIFKTADGGGSGSSVNSHAVAMTIADDLSTTFAGDVLVSGGDIAYGSGQDATLAVDPVSGTDTAGRDLTIKGGQGTGTGDPGNIHLQVAVPEGGSNSTVQTLVPAVTVTAEGVSTFWGGTAALANDTGVGDIVTFGVEDSSDTLAAGRLMYLHTDGKWKYCDADAVATGGTQLLGIALGTAVSDGLLIRGFFKLNSYTEGTWNEGLPCYVSEATGEIDFTAPSASGDFVRVVGYGTDTSGVIFFNPSATNIVIA